MTKHNMQILGVSPFFKLQYSTKQHLNSKTVKTEIQDIYLLLIELLLLCCFGVQQVLFQMFCQ